MKETAAIIQLHKRASGRGQKMVLVTVVEVAGSAYRGPGAHLLIVEDGTRAGTISAGCLESDIMAKQQELFALDGAKVFVYENESDDSLFGLGLGCDGTITLLVEPLAAEHAGADNANSSESDDSSGSTSLENECSTSSLVSRFNFPQVANLANSSGKRHILASLFASSLQELVGMKLLCGLDEMSGSMPARGHSSDTRGYSTNTQEHSCDVKKHSFNVHRQPKVLMDERLPPSLARDVFASLPEVILASRHQIRYYAECAAKVLFEVIEPAIRLILFGAGEDASPVIDIADTLGMNVALIGTRQAKLNGYRERVDIHEVEPTDEQVREIITAPEHTAVVIMSHNYTLDKQFLSCVTTCNPAYLGVMGPARRTRKMLSELGISEPNDNLHYPIGLDIGAESPEEIAVSICSEIVASFRGGTTQPLSTMTSPIHRRARGVSESASELPFTAGSTNA